VSDKEPAHVTVRILEKEYFVSCPQDERADLLDSAEFLNKKMREIRDTGKVVGADRIAVMAALNMARRRRAPAHTSTGSLSDSRRIPTLRL
jgi:cell division protein ZapA